MGRRCELVHGKEGPEKAERGLGQEEAGKKALGGSGGQTRQGTHLRWWR